MPEPESDRVAARVELVHGDQVATAVLDDSVAVRGLLDRLPVSVRLRDSFGVAMVGEVSPELEAGGAPLSCNFLVGEIVYSPADGAIAIFHSADAARLETPGVVRLGRVIGGLEAVTLPASVEVTIQRVG